MQLHKNTVCYIFVGGRYHLHEIKIRILIKRMYLRKYVRILFDVCFI